MAAQTSWNIYGMQLRNCHRMYTTYDTIVESKLAKVSSNSKSNSKSKKELEHIGKINHAYVH